MMDKEKLTNDEEEKEFDSGVFGTNIFERLESDIKKIEAIQTLESDDEKIKELDGLYYDSRKAEVIEMLQSDDKKIEALEKLDDEVYKVSIIKTLQSDDKKIKALEKLNDEAYKLEVIETLQTDDKKIEAMEKLTEDAYKFEVIGILQTYSKTIEALGKLNDEVYKLEVIETLQTDDEKIEAMEKLIDDSYRIEVIEKLQSDSAKIKALEKLSSDGYKANAIAILESDDKKIEELEILNSEYTRAYVIASLVSYDKKINELKKLNSDTAKAHVISLLEDDNKKIEELEKLDDEFAKMYCIDALQEDSKKIEELRKLKDDLMKSYIIRALQSEDKQLEEIERLGNDFAKASIIIALQDNEKQLEELGKLNDELAKGIVAQILQTGDGNLLGDRNKLKELLLEENRKYTEIGLDSNMTIGIEIESEGAMGLAIRALGRILTRQNGEKISEWETKDDGSLYEGVEVVSPILTDNKEDVEDIYMVCSLLQKCGNFTSERCGGHIHIGADYLTSKEAYVNLFEIWGNTEEIIFKMSNEKGNIPRTELLEYASPISSKLNEAIENGSINLENEEDLDSFISGIQNVQEDRYSSLNLLNINNGKNTIEFRISNGTIDPDTWIENVRLYGRIVEMSQRLAEIEKQTEYSQEDKKLIDLRDKLKEEIPEQEKMEYLLELLFTEEEREVYRERYNSTSKILEQTPREINPFKETKFSKVDFKKKHNLTEFQEVAIRERIGATNDVTMETLQGVRTEGNSEKTNDRHGGK